MTPRSLVGRRVLLLFASVVALAAGVGANSFTWGVVFKAHFTGEPDGHGNGLTYPSELGELVSWTGGGESFSMVSPQSGIYSEAFVLTDAEGDSTVDVGLWARSEVPSPDAVRLGFDIVLFSPTTEFLAEVTDIAGVDISIGIRVGAIEINGEPFKASPLLNLPYRVEILLMPLEGRPDLYFIELIRLDTGKTIDEWTGVIPGGFEEVTGLRLIKSGNQPGAVGLDRIEIYRSEG